MVCKEKDADLGIFYFLGVFCICIQKKTANPQQLPSLAAICWAPAEGPLLRGAFVWPSV